MVCYNQAYEFISPKGQSCSILNTVWHDLSHALITDQEDFHGNKFTFLFDLCGVFCTTVSTVFISGGNGCIKTQKCCILSNGHRWLWWLTFGQSLNWSNIMMTTDQYNVHNLGWHHLFVTLTHFTMSQITFSFLDNILQILCIKKYVEYPLWYDSLLLYWLDKDKKCIIDIHCYTCSLYIQACKRMW